MSLKWDKRFLEMARMVASWSQDPNTKVGAVIVRPDRTVASVGFNGFPRGVSDDPAHYADRDYKIATVIHAEENALISSRNQSLSGCTIYVSRLPPCASCASKLIQSGIARVVSSLPYGKEPERWSQNMTWARRNLEAAGVVCEAVE